MPHYRILFSVKSKSFLYQLSAFLLAFLLIISPLAQVYAEESQSSDQSEVSIHDDDSKNISQSTSTMSSSLGPVNPWAPVALDAEPNQSQLLPEPDSSTGATVYGYKIQVPPGRNGVQPDLKLEYNSQNKAQNSIFGYGWSIDIPQISRVNKGGINTLFTDNYFSSSLSGDLINTSGSAYIPSKETSDFIKYTYTSNTWIATDKNGLTYTFGSSASTRQDDPNNSAHISKWMLEKVQDMNGNFISYTYYKNGGQIYPDTIIYTSNGSNTGIFTIDFSRQSRNDVIKDSSSGFVTTTSYRVSQIEAKVNSTWVHRYDLGYTTQSPSDRSLLSTITESSQLNSTTTTLPAQTFTYQSTNSGSWTLATGWSFPDDEYSKEWYSQVGYSNPQVNGHDVSISLNTAHASDGSVSGSLVDVNGDGLLDIVQSFRCLSDGACMPTSHTGIDGAYIYINNGTGWTYNSSWTLPADEYSKEFYNQVSPGNNPQVNGHDVRVSLNTSHITDGSVAGELVDVNGDGLVDIVQSARCLSGPCMPSGHAGIDGVYVYLNTGSGWTYNSSFTLPADEYSKAWYSQMSPGNNPQVNGNDVSISLNTSRSNDGAIAGNLVDINGDGLVDIVQSYRCLATGCVSSSSAGIDGIYIYLNTGTTWVYDSSWSVPADEYSKEFSIQTSISNPQVNSQDVSISLNTSHMSDGSIPGQLVDINGDGLLDIVQSERCLVNSCVPSSNPGIDDMYVYLNTGTGWVYDSSWIAPADEYSKEFSTQNSVSNPQVNSHDIRVSLNTSANNDTSKAGKLIDVNNDGMADIVQSSRCVSISSGCMVSGHPGIDGMFVYLNTGTGWVYDSSFSVPADEYSKELSTQTSASNPQVNSHDVSVSLNTEHSTDTSIAGGFSDVNGDGVVDIVQSGRCVAGSGCIASTLAGIDGVYPYLSSLTAPLLSSITIPDGGSYSLTYKPAQQYEISGTYLNPNTPYTVETLNTITTNDGLGNTNTTSYSYSGGKYYYDSSDLSTRKFAGFEKVTEIRPDGTKVINYYHQGNSTNSSLYEYSDNPGKIGYIYRTDITDASGNIVSRTTTKYDSTNPVTGAYFVYPIQTVTENSGVDTAKEYTYNTTTGNLTTEVDHGIVSVTNPLTFTDTGTDEKTTSYTYANDSSGTIYAVSDISTYDQSSSLVNKTRYYYDGMLLGMLSVGNNTRTDKFTTGSSSIYSEKTYDTYGNMLTSTDERLKTTTYSYDSYNLHVASVTNPLSQVKSYVYDYNTGKPIQVTDENGFIYQTSYDGFGRVLEEKIPDISNPTTLVTKTLYSYTDTPSAVSIHKTDYLNSSNTADSYQYFDGLNRLIQERAEAETSGTFNVRDYTYDARGHKQSESAPYTSSGSSRTSPTTTTTLYTSYTYDPIDRVLTSVSLIGTTTYAYSGVQTSVTDPRGKVKNYYKDAYGNLVIVEEIDGTSTYTTSYTWDLNNKLLDITDALGNIRSFNYDKLGRRLSAEDLHDPFDATYGMWVYSYDNAGNMTQSVSPEGKTVNYKYDDINRLTSENYTGATGVEITYAYDFCTNGVGKLCSVTMTSGADTAYTYDANGNTASEAKTINSTAYTTSYTYDRQGNQLIITYPDNAEARYTYNSAGLLESVDTKESSNPPTPVITNIDYSQAGTPTTIDYANGVTTTNTYDATKLYRLTNRVSVNSSSVNLQDASYTYDADSNITQILDASNTDSAKTANYTYDNLNRLTQSAITSVPSTQTTYTHTFTYDPIGNITSSPVGSYTYAGTSYANPHAITSLGSSTLSYDKDGNTLSDGNLSNTWNYKDQLIASTDNSFFARTYLYDHAGNRVLSDDGSTTTIYPNKYYTDDGTTKTKNIYLGDTLIATVTTVGSTVTPYYNLTDHLNSTNVVTDASGSQVELLDYYPFGSQRIATGSYTSGRQYIGQTFDSDTALNYLNARYYNGLVGQFISEDPMFWAIGDENNLKKATDRRLDQILSDPQGLNSYSYARNNPIHYVDSAGKDYIEINLSVNFQPFSGNLGFKIDFNNLRMDYTNGVGFSTGYSADLSATYNFQDLPKEHKYVTTSMEGTVGYGIVAKGSVESSILQDDDKNIKVSSGTGSAIGVGAGAGFSGSLTTNSNHTLIDYSKQVNYISNLGNKIGNVAQGLKTTVNNIWNNITNNKDKNNGK